MQNKIWVTNIQRFCLHDGPGIRTTVFLKGCNLRCPWCANPENMYFELEKELEEDDFGGFGRALPQMSLAMLYNEIKKDYMWFGDGGGVTFSGGEPLLTIQKLAPLFNELRNDGISLCAETALFVPSESVKQALEYLDIIIIDIKILDDVMCKEILGRDADLEIYERNIQLVESSNIKVIYRVPLIKPYTTNESNIKKIISFLQGKHYVTVELIKGHNLAEKKYQMLNRKCYIVPDLSDEELDDIYHKFILNDIHVTMCQI